MPTESQRERDLQRYYQPWLDARSLVGAYTPSDTSDDVNALTYRGYKPLASKDKALTAFAQLATLRLGVRRAMVSLIDSKQQYILAEATKTLSLVTDTATKAHDQVWLGNAILERHVAVCGTTFGSTYTARDKDGRTMSAEALVVPDMREDDRFKDRSYVVAKPGVLFYAGVPIRTKAGHNIGVYAVSSDEPRFGLTVDELQFMNDVAATVMLHLEMSKAVDDRHKGEKMVRGLARFIEGWAPDSIGNEDDKTPFEEKFPGGGASEYNPTTLSKQTLNAHIEDDDEVPDEARKNRHRGTSFSNHNASHTDAENEDTSQVFHRASRIIRESMAADGVVFFSTVTALNVQMQDAATFQALSDLSDTSDSGFSANSGVGRSKSTKRRANDGGQAGPLLADPSAPSEIPKLCEVVGWAIDQAGSSAALKQEDCAFPESAMERYIKRYPHGKYFSFSESGSGISSDEKSESEAPMIIPSRMNEAQKTPKKSGSKKKRPSLIPIELLKFLPRLRNLIFLPLWDAASEKWSAGAFIWSSNPGRLMSPTHELPFLKAFGNSIMSEVARLNAQKADRAKSTFIASVSHELRSPLHGILGSVEFLQETAMSGYQQGLINSVEACGKTLLDTIDHVLDYAKINKLRGGSQRRKQHMAPAVSNSVLGAEAEFDLSELVEEVVEAVAAGHTFRKSHQNGFFEVNNKVSTDMTPVQTPAGTTSSHLQHEAVDIILDVYPHTGWSVRTQPGAIRRIVMNLLGNALKYTPAGFASVSLKASHLRENDKELDITLRVVDSGKGMSLEYQRTRLFAPFSQEDPFAAGTGLGLSIVRQIVESLKGSITIKSTRHVGTEVEVTLSLPIVTEKRRDTSKIMIPVVQETKHLKAGILTTSGDGVRSNRVAASIFQTCTTWFETDLTEVQDLYDTSKNFFILVEDGPPVAPIVESYVTGGGTAPVVVVTHDTAREIALKAKMQLLSQEASLMMQPISQPCGPFKLCEAYRKVKTYFSDPRPLSPLPPARTTSSTLPIQRPQISNYQPRSFSDLPSAHESAIARPSSPLVGVPGSAMASPRPSTPVDDFKEAVLPPPGITVSSALEDEAVPHVLLVDDNPINLHLLVMFMKKCGYPYTSATNGLEALQAYQAASPAPTSAVTTPGSIDSALASASSIASFTTKRPITHVLMDISMPVMDGFESTRQIRKFEKTLGGVRGWKKCKVIALTGLASQQAQEEAQASGVDAYLAKPVKFRELRKVLDDTATV